MGDVFITTEGLDAFDEQLHGLGQVDVGTDGRSFMDILLHPDGLGSISLLS